MLTLDDPAKSRDLVCDIVRGQFGSSAEHLDWDTDFFEDLDADSLDIAELVTEVEEEFETTLPDEVAEKLTTVGSILAFLLTGTVVVDNTRLKEIWDNSVAA